MEVSEYTNLNKVVRLQNYAREFAFSLRFICVHYYKNLVNPYYIRYYINVEEYNKIIDSENAFLEKLEKSGIKKTNIFKKLVDFLKH